MLRLWLFLCCLPLSAATYTVTARPLTMHVGDAVPPLLFAVSTYTPPYSSLFTGQPTLATTATSSSVVGTYPIIIAVGSMTVTGGNTLTLVAGTMTVIAADGIGAKLTNGLAIPSGYFDGPAYGAINVKSNPIVNLAGDCTTDDTVALQQLLAWGRDARNTTVNTTGTAVTGVSGSSFVGLTGEIQIAGIMAAIASVTDATHLVLTASIPAQTSVALHTGGNVVNTAASGNIVTATSGQTFTGLAVGSSLLLDGTAYTIASVTDATHLVTNQTLADATGLRLYAGSPINSAWGRQTKNLYFPTGCYLVSKPIQVWGTYFTWQGVGAQQSIIKLAPSSPAFNTGSTVAFINNNTNNVNQNFRELVYDMGFEIGPGNPNASIFKWYANNMGTVSNVQIWADDGLCVAGLDLTGSFPGPGLVRNIAIYGCQYGIDMLAQIEYHQTLESITTEDQSVAAIVNQQFHFALRHWLSVEGTIPAYNQQTSTNATTAILDSEIIGSGGTLAINGSQINTSIYSWNNTCTGYTTCAIDNGTGTPITYTTLPHEWWTGPPKTIFNGGQAAGQLAIPEREQPLNADPCTISSCDWQELGPDVTTWAGAIASPTSTVIYVPMGSYAVTSSFSVTVPDSVNFLNFQNANFNLVAGLSYIITVNVAGTSTTPLLIQGCMYSQNCTIHHTGSRAVAVQDASIAYDSTPGAGDLYFQDVITTGEASQSAASDGPIYHSSQHLWFRGYNAENGDAPAFLNNNRFPKFTCDGAQMWILGYKTEQDSPAVVAQNKCQINLFGYFVYYLHLTPPLAGSAWFDLANSGMFAAAGWQFNSGTNTGSPNIANDTQGMSTASLVSPSVSAFISLPAFYSYGAEPGFNFDLAGALLYFNAKIY